MYYSLNSMLFHFDSSAIVIDIEYKNWLNSLSKIGGIAAVVKTIIVVLVRFILKRQWDKQLSNSFN